MGEEFSRLRGSNKGLAESGISFEIVIGCEIHVALLTPTKAFCACENRHGGAPNTRVCPVCLGLPGAMPVPAREFVERGAVAGLALNGRIASLTRFDRKHFFYPDLPKGYQITQAELPLCAGGFVDLEIPGDSGASRSKRVRLERIHLEEDAGKSLHGNAGATLVDFNRAGVPLVEIVTKPDLRSPEEAALFMREVRDVLRWVGVTDGNLEEGSLRCDANVNLIILADGAEWRTPISEIKNLNSFRAVRDACAYEADRQLAEFQGAAPASRAGFSAGFKRTMGWNPDRGVTVPQREKNSFVDYRFAPEPDILPIRISDTFIARASSRVGELPGGMRRRFMETYGLSRSDATVLTADRVLAEWYDRAARSCADPRKAASWVITEVLAAANARSVSVARLGIGPEHVAELVNALAVNLVSGAQAKEAFAECLKTGKMPRAVIEERGLSQMSDPESLYALVEAVLRENGEAVAAWKNGKTNAAAWLTGQVMKRSGGRANPRAAADGVQKKLAEL